MIDIKQCEVCHIGTMHPMQAAYTTSYHKQLVLVPDIDAWVCDVCGDFWHDPDSVARIELLLGSTRGDTRKDRHPKTSGDQAPHPIPTTNRSRSV